MSFIRGCSCVSPKLKIVTMKHMIKNPKSFMFFNISVTTIHISLCVSWMPEINLLTFKFNMFVMFDDYILAERRATNLSSHNLGYNMWAVYFKNYRKNILLRIL